jgi:type VI secretion system protein ImpA
MSDVGADGYQPPPPVDRWLQPLADGSGSGPDLEYDPEALELIEVSGKPETQFGPAEPPNWGRMREITESLLTRTRDLRFATTWARAQLNVDGYPAFPAALALLHGLLDLFWDDLNPKPDAEDSEGLSRLSILGSLAKLDGLLGDLRGARLSSDRQLENLRVRDAEISSGKAKPRSGESARTKAQLTAMLEAAPEAVQALREQTTQSIALLKRLKDAMVARFGADKAVDLKGVEGMLASVTAVLPAAEAGVLTSDGVDPGAPTNGSGRRASDGIDSREDAIRAIEQVCDYLERNEPTNPAQLLLRRAARVIDKNFLQLVKDLAPDAVREVAKVMGVDPATVKDDE